MTPSPTNANTLLGVLALYRRILGRKLYALAVLMPVSSLSEGFGIALLLPLLSVLDSGRMFGGTGGSLARRILASLPLPESPFALLSLIAGAFLVKAAVKFVTDALEGFFHAKLMFRLKTELVAGYTNLAYPAFTRQNTGHYVNIVTGQTNRFATVFQNICQLFMHAITAIVFLGLAALTNWEFAAVASLAGLTFMWALKTLNTYVRELSRRTAREQSHLNKQLVQVLHALKYLIATERTNILVQRVRTSCRRLFGYEVRSKLAGAFTTSIREPLSVILILTLVAIQIQYFDQRLGSILVALVLLHRATQSLFNIANTWQKAMQMLGSAEMIQDELHFVAKHREDRGPETMEDFQDAVEFQNVSFAYNRADGEVLRQLNLRIPRNQTVAFVGHSGAGKSTLADLLTLLLQPTTGQIVIDGHDTRYLDPRSWRRQLGYVCQETVVFDETVAANICLSETAYRQDPECRQRVHAAAEQAFASSFIEAMPDGYDTIVGDRGVRLSGGQRQRLFIARELYKQPRLLILDEATSALDGASEKAIQESIDALQGQMTVVVIAHRLATIKNTDYIYVLDRGLIIEHGPYDQLHRNLDSRFRRMVELQSL